jgi:hypothetical protein
VHFSRSSPSNSWWQTMAGWHALSRPSAAEGGGRRPAFTGLATQPYPATEVDGWQHKAQPGVSKPGRSTEKGVATASAPDVSCPETHADPLRTAARADLPHLAWAVFSAILGMGPPWLSESVIDSRNHRVEPRR